jgi:biopolymer transport protein ExbB/TolQ
VDWNLISMLHAMSWTALSVVIMLLLMSVISIVLAVERGLRYSVARNQSRAFVVQVAAALDAAKLDDIISIAERNKKSHIAAMVATGLAEFQLAPSHVSGTEMIDAAKRGLERSVATIHAELKRGLSGLATIGSTAPFVGLFGTVVGIMNAFRATAPTKSAGITTVASGISEALVTTALGLLVAVPAV